MVLPSTLLWGRGIKATTEPLILLLVEALIHGVFELHREDDDLPETVLRTPGKGYTLPYFFPALSFLSFFRARQKSEMCTGLAP